MQKSATQIMNDAWDLFKIEEAANGREVEGLFDSYTSPAV